jgi:hypothetical protein
MPTLSPELREEIERAGDDPVRIEDPDTHTAYVLLKADVYDRIKPVLAPLDRTIEQVPEGIRRAREAFLRDLPVLLARKRLRGRWALYHGHKQIRISRRTDKLLRECDKRGLAEDDYYLGWIGPHSTDPDDDEIEHSFFEFDDCEPVS